MCFCPFLPDFILTSTGISILRNLFLLCALPAIRIALYEMYELCECVRLTDNECEILDNVPVSCLTLEVF